MGPHSSTKTHCIFMTVLHVTESVVLGQCFPKGPDSPGLGHQQWGSVSCAVLDRQRAYLGTIKRKLLVTVVIIIQWNPWWNATLMRNHHSFKTTFSETFPFTFPCQWTPHWGPPLFSDLFGSIFMLVWKDGYFFSSQLLGNHMVLETLWHNWW